MSNEQVYACLETFGERFLHRQASSEQAITRMADDYRQVLIEMGIDIGEDD